MLRRAWVGDDSGDLISRVAEVLFVADPIGINLESNVDEYRPEAEAIVSRLPEAASQSELQRVVHEEFVRWFTIETAGPIERYRSVAERIWKLWSGDGNPKSQGWGYVPSSALPDTHTYTNLGNVTVNGETFAVRRRDDGAVHYDWISGPNDGYGFSSFGNSEALSPEQHAASIRDFLSAIDPATGYFYNP